MTDLKNTAHDAMKTAQGLGLNEVAISASRNRFLDISYRDGKLEKIQESTSRSLDATLYHEGRYSSSTTSDLRPDAVQRFLEQARDMTVLLTADPFRALPDPSLYEGQADVDLQLEDPDYATLDIDRRKQLVETLWTSARGDDRVISATSGTYDSASESVLLHSNGFEGQRRSTNFWMGAQVTVRDEGDRRPMGSWWIGDRRHGALTDPEGVGHEALQRALQRLGSEPATTRRCPMVIENKTARRVLSPLFRALSGRALQQRRSFLEGKQGEQVLSDRITVTDNPLLPRGFGSRLYDGEGIAAKQMPVFEGGVLANYFIDTYYGKKLEMAPTTGGSSNIVLTPGKLSAKKIHKKVRDGILVTSFLGGNSDPTTGDYSFGIRGHLLERGKIGAPVSEMNITGNLLELWANLTHLGNDPYPYSSMLVPTLAFDDIQFSGIDPQDEG